MLRALLRIRFFRSTSSIVGKPVQGKRRRGKISCLSFAFFVPVSIIAATSIAESFAPERIDPDYHYRKSLWAHQRDVLPSHRHAILIGSSRTAQGFIPSAAEPAFDSQGRPVDWFNFSHVGFGPVMNAVTLSRFERDGLRPDAIVLEIMPTMFVKENHRFQMGHVSWQETHVLAKYNTWGTVFSAYFRTRLDRLRTLNPFSPWISAVAPVDATGGWMAYDRQPSTPQLHKQRIDFQRDAIGGYCDEIHARPGTEETLIDAAAWCRARQIDLIFYRSPEGPICRSWYPPERLAAFDAWLEGVAKRVNVRIVDARRWIGEEGFKDSHHPNREGAAEISKRLIREITPMLGR